jgi:hypothetical protein
MRMWMVDPEIMCRKHLLGEHVELHMFIWAMNKNQNLSGYLNNNLLEPLSIKKRHDKLVLEMTARGYNHKSPISQPKFIRAVKKLSLSNRKIVINKDKAFWDLINRCDECKRRANN